MGDELYPKLGPYRTPPPLQLTPTAYTGMYKGWDVRVREQQEGPRSLRYWHISRRDHDDLRLHEASFSGIVDSADDAVEYIRRLVDCLESGDLLPPWQDAGT
jgi:hypothetical protein